MEWQEISIATNERMLEAVSNIFIEIGADGVVIEDPNVVSRYINKDVWDCYDLPEYLLKGESVVIKGYLPADKRLPGRINRLKSKILSLERYFENFCGEISTKQIREEDWAAAWKAYFKTHRVGEKIIITPPWESHEPVKGDILITLNPGLAFGTGIHPTTQLCIKALEKYLIPGNTVYDVGTGSGVLAVTAAKLGAKHVLACDNDAFAVDAALENVKQNNIENLVTVVKNNLLDGFSAPAHLITANIVSKVILKLQAQAFQMLYPKGYFIACGILKDHFDSIKDELKSSGFLIAEVLSDDDWTAVVAQRK